MKINNEDKTLSELLINPSVYTCHRKSYQISRSLPLLLLDIQMKYSTHYAISVKQSQRTKKTFKNTITSEGQLQPTQSKTLQTSASLKQSETQS